MATPAFCKLIDQICQLANIPNSSSFYETADLQIDDIQFTLIDSSTDTQQGADFFCDFGLPPEWRRAEALQRLLEHNMLMSGTNAPVFSVNGETGHVLLMGRVAFEKMSSLDILNTLVQYAARATEWRTNHYLQEFLSRPAFEKRGARHAMNSKVTKSKASPGKE